MFQKILYNIYQKEKKYEDYKDLLPKYITNYNYYYYCKIIEIVFSN